MTVATSIICLVVTAKLVCAKKITCPRGRAAVTTDKAYIYIQEVDNHETLVGVVTHNHVKKYAPMFDPVGYKN